MSAADARESLAEGFRSGLRLHDTDGWTRERRQAAFACFEKLGFPGRREETWRHSNLAPLREVPFRPGADAASEIPDEMVASVGDAHRIVLSSTGLRVEEPPEAFPEGFRILPFSELSDERRARFAALARSEADCFVALNTALFDRGAVIELDSGTVLDRPVHIVHELVGRDEPVAAFPRVLIVAEAGSEASVIEHYRTRGDAESLTGPVTEIFVGEGARIDHVRLQEESTSSFHVARVMAAQQRGSRFRSWSFALGGRFSRVDIEARLEGEGAECALEGLFAGRGTQHLDHYTRIDHASPHTSSRECYKGILDGRARGVFLGHILVRPGAQKIDAGQTSRSVILSDSARVNMKPWLEIYADDVRCAHGTTVGRLDADSLFYLRSRGIAMDDARAILVRAFASEVLGSLPIETLRDRMERTIQDWLQGPTPRAAA